MMEWFGKMVDQGKQDEEVAAIFEVIDAETRLPRT